MVRWADRRLDGAWPRVVRVWEGAAIGDYGLGGCGRGELGLDVVQQVASGVDQVEVGFWSLGFDGGGCAAKGFRVCWF